MWKVRDESELSDGSETTESPRLTPPRQALEIPSLAEKMDKIGSVESTDSQHSLGTL